MGNTFKEIYFLTQKDVHDDSVHKVVTKWFVRNDHFFCENMEVYLGIQNTPVSFIPTVVLSVSYSNE